MTHNITNIACLLSRVYAHHGYNYTYYTCSWSIHSARMMLFAVDKVDPKASHNHNEIDGIFLRGHQSTLKHCCSCEVRLWSSQACARELSCHN